MQLLRCHKDNITKKTTYHTNGSVSVEEGCAGWGICKANIRTSSGQNYGNNNGNIGIAADYILNMSIVITTNNEILLGVDSNQINDDSGSFFYDDTIKFLNEGEVYTIDNQEVLNQLGANSPIHISGGEYSVINTPDGGKYIQVGIINN